MNCLWPGCEGKELQIMKTSIMGSSDGLLIVARVYCKTCKRFYDLFTDTEGLDAGCDIGGGPGETPEPNDEHNQ